jgi:biotin carboxyl carrier protein
MAHRRPREFAPVISINGKPVEAATADTVETEPNVYSVLSNGKSYEVRVTGNEITIGGTRLRFEAEDPRQWKRSTQAASAQARASLTAAMPGRIVRILVAVGEEVTVGQGILVIEAMKMQNELKSPRAGKVAAIEAREGENVNAGARLVTIE